ncbi:hypothetical protein SIID45300_01335 [Candidatus Magnetaquicoccaceae bacterium FCR-1]|uniref:Prepilin-type N-terminal cleavage/methylation domain-containing protein n=1 Tax=Candidatus Magnetaquiglobus chichijimensis TaxID=3141448 RepID=A0ABQ0C800_9PROT
MQRLRGSSQKGFSLVEIAIVLMIIGLLIGGVLKGMSMVKNTKIKRLALDTQATQGAINTYADAYWMLPGDDAGAASRWAVGATPGNGNGMIEGLFLAPPANRVPSSSASPAETALAWNHLYCEGLLKGTCLPNGTTTPIAQPLNPAGGLTGIADGRLSQVLGITKKMVCMKDIPSEYAMVYDTQFDDGHGETGDIRGSDHNEDETTPGTATPYQPDRRIHICTGF